MQPEESRPTPPPVPRASPPAEPGLELVEDDDPVSPRPAAARSLNSSDPPSSGECAVLDEPSPKAAAAEPVQRRKARLSADEDLRDVEGVDEDDQGSRLHRPRRNKKRPAESAQTAIVAGLIAGGAVALIWIIMTPLAFYFRPVAFAMLIGGGLAGVTSRAYFRKVARQELGSSYFILKFVPFYDAYFFVIHIRRMLLPFVFWLAGFFFITAGGLALVLHQAGAAMESSTADFSGNHETPAAKLDTPQGADGEATRLLSGRKKEARAWLREPDNRRDRSLRELAAAVEKAYKNGAKEISVVGYDENDDEDLHIIITLPTEPAERQRLFTWFRDDIDPDAHDVGQKYLFLLAPRPE
jgi:hypothetical protein